MKGGSSTFFSHRKIGRKGKYITHFLVNRIEKGGTINPPSTCVWSLPNMIFVTADLVTDLTALIRTGWQAGNLAAHGPCNTDRQRFRPADQPCPLGVAVVGIRRYHSQVSPTIRYTGFRTAHRRLNKPRRSPAHWRIHRKFRFAIRNLLCSNRL